tara:strand:- start:51 stop:245 length:195 start_codon:yes stop_codon:yes gene_type:complete
MSKKEEIIMSNYQDEYIRKQFGDDYDWSLEKEEWSTDLIEVKFSDGETIINAVWVGIPDKLTTP